MPAVPEGVYRNRTRGTWYFKATLGRDAVGGRLVQVTHRRFELVAARAHITALVGHELGAWPNWHPRSPSDS